MPPIIEIKALNKSFETVPAVKDLTLTVEQGEIFGLVGPDGAGKTTTLRMCTGVMSIDSGSIAVKGFDVEKETDKVKSVIGYMPQRFSLYDDLSVEENIDFFAELYGVKKVEREKMKKELYGFSHLDKFKTRQAGKLSGGMQKKLALTCALINVPDVLMLDEPTIGVDPLSRQELWEMLLNLNKEKNVSILVTTSYMDEIERCNRVGMLYAGSLLLVEKLEVLLAKGERFEDVFIREIEKVKAGGL